MDVEQFAWLRSSAGAEVLADADALTSAEDDALRAAELLRRRHPGLAPGLAATAMTQAGLRRRATSKFGALATRMWFTPDGLEQATRLEVARHRAARISFARPSSVVDVGCGVGADLVAIAESGPTTAGVDLDPVRVAVAQANLESLGLPGAVLQADATALDLSAFGVVFADPARRSARGRVFDVDAYAPPWSFVEGLLRRPACVKVAPGIPHERVPGGVEGEWVSFAGEVKEAVLWSPQLATARRRATLITHAGLATLTEDEDPGHGTPGPMRRHLYEPDGAVIRAALVTAVADAVGGTLVDEHIAYVTSDAVVATPFARGYEVLEEVPYHLKQLKAALRSRGIGRLTIKKRGVDIVPEELRRRLDLRGDGESVLVLTRVEGRGAAYLVRPHTG